MIQVVNVTIVVRALFKKIKNIIHTSFFSWMPVWIIHEETKVVTTNFNEKMQSVKKIYIYSTCLFSNYSCIIDIC